jgi:FemAB-related protein (PEP-CTERM system-associated)
MSIDAQKSLAGATTPSPKARPFEARDRAAWDAFVFAHPQGTFFHRIGWREIFADEFRLTPRYLVCERGPILTGILPLVHQKSLLFGNALISAPFCVEGGPLALDEESEQALDAAAKDVLTETRAAHLEFRSRKATRADWTARRDLYATFRRPISDNHDANLKDIPRKQRAVVRKTLTGGLTSDVDERVNRFFPVYAESVRNLGTPVFAKSYFERLKKTFGPDCDMVVVLDAGKPVSAVMNFYFGKTVLPYYGGGTFEARRSGANDFLYWEVIRRAAERGFREFDFGRSKAGTGAFAFKHNWGFEPEWLEYEYLLKPGQALPEKNPTNPKFSLLIKLWQRLPLPVANLLGPMLVRSLG